MPLTAHQDCVLVVIDAQPGFFPEELADRPAALEALARAAWLAELAHELDVAVVATEEEPERNGSTALELAPGTPVRIKPTFGLAGTPEILRTVNGCGWSSVRACCPARRHSACDCPRSLRVIERRPTIPASMELALPARSIVAVEPRGSS